MTTIDLEYSLSAIASLAGLVTAVNHYAPVVVRALWEALGVLAVLAWAYVRLMRAILGAA